MHDVKKYLDNYVSSDNDIDTSLYARLLAWEISEVFSSDRLVELLEAEKENRIYIKKTKSDNPFWQQNLDMMFESGQNL